MWCKLLCNPLSPAGIHSFGMQMSCLIFQLTAFWPIIVCFSHLVLVVNVRNTESHVRSEEKQSIGSSISKWIPKAFISSHFTIIPLSHRRWIGPNTLRKPNSWIRLAENPMLNSSFWSCRLGLLMQKLKAAHFSPHTKSPWLHQCFLVFWAFQETKIVSRPHRTK